MPGGAPSPHPPAIRPKTLAPVGAGVFVFGLFPCAGSQTRRRAPPAPGGTRPRTQPDGGLRAPRTQSRAHVSTLNFAAYLHLCICGLVIVRARANIAAIGIVRERRAREVICHPPRRNSFLRPRQSHSRRRARSPAPRRSSRRANRERRRSPRSLPRTTISARSRSTSSGRRRRAARPAARKSTITNAGCATTSWRKAAPPSSSACSSARRWSPAIRSTTRPSRTRSATAAPIWAPTNTSSTTPT